MLDELLKSKFYTKCKSLLKMLKARLEASKKNKGSVANFLKKNMADLLRGGLDYHAFCRAEGLLVEQKMIACYNFIEQFHGCISSNLSFMNKQRECPEECREAVQSLIYAAARIAELPELRDLRTLFTERYGTCESFINKEFIETLKPASATKEMKLQLMLDIAAEFALDWNSKSLEQKLFKPPPVQEEDQHRHSPKSKYDSVLKAECKQGNDGDGYKWKKNKEDDFTKGDSHETGCKGNGMSGDTLPQTDKRESASCGRKNSIGERYNLPSSTEGEVISPHKRRDSSDLDSLQASSNSIGSVSEDEVDSKKPFYYRFIPPPYVKPKIEKENEGRMIEEEPPKPNAEETSSQVDLVNEAKPKPRSVRRRSFKAPPGNENVASTERPLKPPPGPEKLLSFETVAPAKTNIGVAKEGAKWGSRLSRTEDVDQRDEEEKMPDRLLRRYSKDKAKTYEIDTDELSSQRNSKSDESALLPGRQAFQLEEASPIKATKGHTRAVSLQTETVTGHVHPNLPDYDDLAARLAALKGR